MSLIFKAIKVGYLETNCYITSCEDTGHTFIIDPGDNPKAISDYIQRNEFIPKGIILTHGHPDHTGAVKALRGKMNVFTAIHENDLLMLKVCGIDKTDRFLSDGEHLDLGRQKLKVIHTPGHTRGGVCLLWENILFSGDTLFKDGVGRTDLPGGSFSDLEKSITEKLFTLDPETAVYPGHGPSTTIASEKKHKI